MLSNEKLPFKTDGHLNIYITYAFVMYYKAGRKREVPVEKLALSVGIN